jgi:hypothetical protein
MAEPEPELFNPYQISTTEWLPLEAARTQVTPPPLTPVIETLLLAEDKTRALAGWGEAFKVASTLEAEA